MTGVEIHDGLNSIDDDKSPDINGYNAYFYKMARHIIIEDVIVVVK